MHLLTSLRKLAVGGRSVITTIHQPSSRLYQQLDKLLLLSQGCAACRYVELQGPALLLPISQLTSECFCVCVCIQVVL